MQDGHSEDADLRIGNLDAVETTHTRREPRLDVDATLVAAHASASAASGKGAPGKDARRKKLVRPPAGRDLALWSMVAGVVILLLAVVAQQLQQTGMRRALAALEVQAASSVQNLEDKVSDTRSTLATTDDAVRTKLDGLAAEVKRLRDVLVKVQSLQGRQASALGALDKKATGLGNDLQALVQADAGFDARLRTLVDGVDALSADVVRQGQTLERVAQAGDIARLRGEVAVLGSSLREMVAEQDRRLRAGEQAMASVDAFRRQVNQTLDLHTRQIGELANTR